MPPDEPVANTDTNGEGDPVPKSQVYLFGVYLILLNLLLILLLVWIWPSPVPGQDHPTALVECCSALYLPAETRYLLIVIIAGALGSYIHLATSFADYVGNRQLFRSWMLWYVLRPFIGMALALLVYFTARAGLMTITSSDTTAQELSPFAVAAIAGLAGMFSRQATDKLREVFENFLTTKTPPDRADKLKSD